MPLSGRNSTYHRCSVFPSHLFLTTCLEDENPDLFLSGLASAARAKGMTEVAKKSGLDRESLYKALSPGAHPRHETIRKIIAALDLKLTVAV